MTAVDNRVFLASRVDRRLDQMAEDFRKLAEKIEEQRATVARIGGDNAPEQAADIASAVVQAITNTVNAVGLSGLIQAAADYDLNTRD